MKYFALHKLSLNLGIFLLVPLCSFSEVVTLKDGTKIDAIELSKNKDFVLAKTKYGEMIINPQDIVISSESGRFQSCLDRKFGEFYGVGTKDELLTMVVGKIISQNLQIGLSIGYGYGGFDTYSANQNDRIFGADVFKAIPISKQTELGFGLGVYVKEDNPSPLCGKICPGGVCPTCESRTDTTISPSISLYYAISKKSLLGIGIHSSLGPTFQLAFSI